MRKSIFSLGLIAAAAFTLTNCTKEQLDAPVQEKSGGVPFEVVASTDATKTSFNEDLSTDWVAGDQICLAYGLGNDYKAAGAFTTAEGDGVFAGELPEELAEGQSYNWIAMYPYCEHAVGSELATTYIPVTYPAVTVQDGYNSVAHIAGANAPLYGIAENVPAGQVPAFTMQHMASVIAVNITNNSDSPEPLVINDVRMFVKNQPLVGDFWFYTEEEDVVPADGAGIIATTEVKNATEIAKGETATVYLVIAPVNIPAEATLNFTVNDCANDIYLDKAVSFAPGKIRAMNFSYTDAAPITFVYAEAEAAMDGQRVEFDIKDIPAWAKNLKDLPNTCETIKSAAEAIRNQEFYTAYELLGGVPGFVKKTKTFEGFGRALIRVKYTASDFVQSITDEIAQINSIESLQAYIQKVEDIYQVSGMEASVDEALGSMEAYVPASIKNQLWYPIVKNYFESLTLSSIVDKAVENQYIAKVLNKVFENEEFLSTLRTTLNKYVSDIEKKYNDQISSDNQNAWETALELAKAEVILAAKIAAKQDAEKNFTVENEQNVAKLHRTPWGLFQSLLNSDYCKKQFDKLGIAEVYDALQQLSAEVESLVKWSEGTYTVEICENDPAFPTVYNGWAELEAAGLIEYL